VGADAARVQHIIRASRTSCSCRHPDRSGQPIRIDRPAIEARLADPHTREYFGAAGIDIGRQLMGYLEAPVMYGPEFPRDRMTDINTDLFPKDEFDLSPRR